MPLILGDFEFADFEIPEVIAGLGGTQSNAKHGLIGGARIVNAMGQNDSDPHWTGRFRGAQAATRCQQLDWMRKAGEQLPLIFGSFFFTVLIDSFTYDYEREYQIRYQMKVIVINSDVLPTPPSLTDLVNADLLSLSGSVSDFDEAVANVS
jgi:hypothetical protein